MLLPLVLHLHVTTTTTTTAATLNVQCHFFERTTPTKLNSHLVRFANLLIINFIPCKAKKCYNNNHLLTSWDKVLYFKYAIFINCNTIKLNSYIVKDDTKNNQFKLKLGKLILNRGIIKT